MLFTDSNIDNFSLIIPLKCITNFFSVNFVANFIECFKIIWNFLVILMKIAENKIFNIKVKKFTFSIVCRRPEGFKPFPELKRPSSICLNICFLVLQKFLTFSLGLSIPNQKISMM